MSNLKQKKQTAIIVVFDEKQAIGYNNQLLCSLPKDLKYFKKLTEGQIVVMGRKTYESLPKKPLPNRKNIVLTRNRHPNAFPQCKVIHNLETFFQQINKETKKVFFIGGEQIYEAVIKKVDELFITKIHHTFEQTDCFFPEIDFGEWELINQIDHNRDQNHHYNFSFLHYIRKQTR